MKRVIIDFKRTVIMTALTEDNSLVELIPETRRTDAAAGDVYVGIIKKILKSGFAFVDIGEEKNAFLYLDDKKEAHLKEETGKLTLKEGMSMTVQVIRPAEKEKGAAVTTALSLGGSLCVVEKGRGNIRISRKITDEKKRSCLKEALVCGELSGWDVVVRTKAENVSSDILRAEALRLKNNIEEIYERAEYRKAPACLCKAETASLAAIKYFLSDITDHISEHIVINDKEEYCRFIDRGGIYSPVLYSGSSPIFREFFIERETEKIFSSKVWLKSGGYLIIEPTEAMVVIDVNSGKNNAKVHEDAVFKTNCEAAKEVLRQLRLRNLSGTIIVDFINMKTADHNTALVELLREEAKKDRISVTVVGMAPLGLVLITRKKSGLPVIDCLARTCPLCGGKGYVR